MIPEAWASIRSIARCVLPVLVGPRTAFTRGRNPREHDPMVEVATCGRCLGLSARALQASAPSAAGARIEALRIESRQPFQRIWPRREQGDRV